jgi:RNA-binding protein YhbY
MTTILSGKERGRLKSLAKTRPVDLKVGKKGITPTLLLELRRLLDNEPLIKVRLAPEKNTRLEQVKQLEEELSVTLIAMIGKTASFSIAEQ